MAFKLVTSDGRESAYDDGDNYSVRDSGVLEVRKGDTRLLYAPGAWTKVEETPYRSGVEHRHGWPA